MAMLAPPRDLNVTAIHDSKTASEVAGCSRSRAATARATCTPRLARADERASHAVQLGAMGRKLVVDSEFRKVHFNTENVKEHNFCNNKIRTAL